MATEPIKSLEMHYTMIQFSIKVNSFTQDKACDAMEIFDELVESEVSIVTPHLKTLVEFCLQVCRMFDICFVVNIDVKVVTLKYSKLVEEYIHVGSRVGVLVRTLAFHQCGLGSIPGLGVMWAEFVGSLLCSERFFSGYSSFPLSSKNRYLI